MKFYTDNAMSLDFLNPINNSKDESQNKTIDRYDFQTKKDYNNSSALLDRQFAQVLYTTNYNIESELRNPEPCKQNKILKNNDIDKVINNNNKTLNDNNRTFNDDTGLLIKDIDLEIKEKYTINCSQKRKNLDWSDYRTPPKQINGQGFGNPNNYYQTRYGLDSRNDCLPSVRDADFEDREMVPIDAMLWNYGGINYQDDIRSGTSTRNYKKTNAKWANAKN